LDFLKNKNKQIKIERARPRMHGHAWCACPPCMHTIPPFNHATHACMHASQTFNCRCCVPYPHTRRPFSSMHMYGCMRTWCRRVHVCVRGCICVHVCLYVCMHACMHLCMHACVRACVCMHVCVRACAYACVQKGKGQKRQTLSLAAMSSGPVHAYHDPILIFSSTHAWTHTWPFLSLPSRPCMHDVFILIFSHMHACMMIYPYLLTHACMQFTHHGSACMHAMPCHACIWP
jgi:hypothetical protein